MTSLTRVRAPKVPFKEVFKAIDTLMMYSTQSDYGTAAHQAFLSNFTQIAIQERQDSQKQRLITDFFGK